MLNSVLSALDVSRPAGVLWDMDGTILDTEGKWAELSIELVRAHGGIWTDEDSEYVNGASTENHMARMIEAVRRGGESNVEPNALFYELGVQMAKRVYPDPEWVPGARQLLEIFRDNNIPQALVTATPKELVEVFLDGLDVPFFDAIVTGSEPIPGKPDPAPYRLGAERLGVDPRDCIAFEDSSHGYAAAEGAGATVFHVIEQPFVERMSFLK